jgi:alginate production protein
MHRFGEAFRGELSNLQVATAFTSWQMGEDYDASVVYHRFWRVDDNQDVGQSGIIAPLEDGEKDIGQEMDLVVTRYFKQGLLPASMAEHLDERSALVRFRGGVFKPGDAYASGTDSLMHRAFVDFIWRF